MAFELYPHQEAALAALLAASREGNVLTLRSSSGYGRSTAMSRFAAGIEGRRGLLVSPSALHAHWRRQLEDAGLATRAAATTAAFLSEDASEGVLTISHHIVRDVPYVLDHVADFDWVMASIGTPGSVLERLRRRARRLFMECDGPGPAPAPGPGLGTIVDMPIPVDQV